MSEQRKDDRDQGVGGPSLTTPNEIVSPRIFTVLKRKIQSKFTDCLAKMFSTNLDVALRLS